MEVKVKKGSLINKTWERCKSIGRGIKSTTSSPPRAAARGMTTKSKSWPRMITVAASPDQAAAEEYHHHRNEKQRENKKVKGCFSVYVGPQKQRFVVKTEYANHPLFKMLLEEAESEFGYDNQGPLMLPCNVDIFYKVLMEMDDTGGRDDKIHPGCGFVKRHASYHVLSPSRMVAINQF